MSSSVVIVVAVPGVDRVLSVVIVEGLLDTCTAGCEGVSCAETGVEGVFGMASDSTGSEMLWKASN